MAQRKDGQKTRARLLQAACKVFACKGFHQATVADICRQAGANVAAVSYYFGDKAGLYVAAWQRAFQTFSDQFPLTPPEGAATSAEAALRGQVRRLVLEFSRQDSNGEFARLYMLELARPSGLVDRTWHEMVNTHRQRLQELIRAVLGPQAPEEDVLFCEMSIINQCRAFVTTRRSDLEFMMGQTLTPEVVEKMADHITRFSLGGVRAVRDRSPQKLLLPQQKSLPESLKQPR
ncbi:MAG: CerR family C-terminal domain-containing protein [Desulfobacteraceae bacterium]|nr:CerR family C-terminal domain-containing protein [Desulfobacteraceae bacterium]